MAGSLPSHLNGTAIKNEEPFFCITIKYQIQIIDFARRNYAIFTLVVDFSKWLNAINAI